MVFIYYLSPYVSMTGPYSINPSPPPPPQSPPPPPA